jgi:hypothetical protein
MVRKIIILLVLINVSVAYGDDPGISSIVLYLINDQSGDHKLTSMSFQKYKLGYFALVKGVFNLPDISLDDKERLSASLKKPTGNS